MEVKQGFGDERRGWKEKEREREREWVSGRESWRDVVQERRKSWRTGERDRAKHGWIPSGLNV